MNKFLTEYFSTKWLEGNRSLNQYTYSGWALIDQVLPGERVLDVGCGLNSFKGKIPLLHGIDITNVGSDEQVSIDDFETDQLFDVAFCLGSINFGSKEVIRDQIRKVDSVLNNGRIYWRCNPGLADHQNNLVQQVDFFPWTIPLHEQWSAEFGYKLQNVQQDHKRIYCEWIKLD